MEFKPRAAPIEASQLIELLGVCPSLASLQQGFKLQDAEVNSLLQAANDLSAGVITVDPGTQGADDLLQQALAVLQLGVEVLTRDNESLANDCNNLQQDMQELERENASLQEENDMLREQQDGQTGVGDLADLSRNHQDLLQKLAEKEDKIFQLLEQQEKDAEQMKSWETRLRDAEGDIRNRVEETEQLRGDLQHLQSQLRDAESLLATQTRSDNRRELQDHIKQHEWKIERLTKDNRALSTANTELRSKIDELKEENLQVSERIVLLDEHTRSLKLREADLEDKLENQQAENGKLLEKQMELYAEVQDKISLLEAFEEKFTRQYRSWEEETALLQAQIKQLKAESRSKQRSSDMPSTANTETGSEDSSMLDNEVLELREQIREAREKEVLLLEAYEQLEKDVGLEVDRALSQQRDDLERLRKRTEFLEQHLENERTVNRKIKDEHVALEKDLQDLEQRNQAYEQGIYGLPQATLEIKQLREQCRDQDTQCRQLTHQLNQLSSKIEDLYDENTVLRQKAGTSDSDRVDISQLKQLREALVMQLRSVNNMLECQVSDLEEERRKLRMELKFRAKYHGQHALEMGLAPEQLLLVEQYVDDIKYGRNPEGDLVTQLQKRVEFLEVRLAEVMAFADIPPSIRPLLDKSSGMSLVQVAASPSTAAQNAQTLATADALVELLDVLKQVHTKLDAASQEGTPVPAGSLSSFVKQLQEAEEMIVGLQKLMERPGFGRQNLVSSLTSVKAADGSPEGHASSSKLDGLAQQLTNLSQLVIDQQQQIAEKDVQLVELRNAAAPVLASPKLASPKPLQGSDKEVTARASMASAEAPRVGQQVDSKEQDGLAKEDSHVLRTLLLDTMQMLAVRENELNETKHVCMRHQKKLQSIRDNVKMMYRDYANAWGRWKVERQTMQKKMATIQEEVDGYKLANQELERGLQSLSSRSPDRLQKDLADTVLKMAVVQIKHARVGRQLEASSMSEKALQDRVISLEQELMDVTSTCRLRVSWLETSITEVQQRNELLLQELQGSAPVQAYHQLLKKHIELMTRFRFMVENTASNIASNDELLQLRQDVADLTCHLLASAQMTAKLKTQVQHLEIHCKGQVAPEELHSLQLQELVSATVELETASTRALLADKEKQRIQRTLDESRERIVDLESRMARISAELVASQANATQLQHALEGGRTAEQTKELLARLLVAEQSAAVHNSDVADKVAEAEDAKRLLRDVQRKFTMQLAQSTNLRTAMREVMAGAADNGKRIGKLHLELEHIREKEALSRSALNRSELDRLDLEKQVRELREHLVKSQAQGTVLLKQVRWAEEQRKKAQEQLQVELADRVEAWKARQWSRKLQQLEKQNRQLSSYLSTARGRILELEDAITTEELQEDAQHDKLQLLQSPVSQVHAEAVQLRDQVLQLKLDVSRSQREGLVLREQAAYLERVNQELQKVLETYEQEELKERHILEEQRQEATAQAVQLQEQIATLHTQLNTVITDADARIAAARSSARSAIAAASGAAMLSGQPRVAGVNEQGPDVRGAQFKVPDGADVTDSLIIEAATDMPRIQALVQNMAVADRAVMLNQIETLKKVREEAEYLRHERNNLQRDLSKKEASLMQLQSMYDEVLERLSQQSQAQLALYAGVPQQPDTGEIALNTLKAVAQATIQELQAKLEGKEKQMADLEASLKFHQDSFRTEHEHLRNQMQELKRQIWNKEGLAIEQAREAMELVQQRIGLKGSGNEEITYDELKRLLEQTAAHVEEKNNIILQKDNSLMVLKKDLQLQEKRYQLEIDRVKARAELAKDESNNPKYLVDKLKAQLKAKDEKLKQLKEAIKQLEQRLVDKMKEVADFEMLEATLEEQKDMDERIKKMADERKALLSKLESARSEVLDLRAQNKVRDEEIQHKKEEISKDVQASKQLRAELSKERLTLANLRKSQAQAVDLSSSMSIEAKQQLEKLQQRILVLEKQNNSLKKIMHAEREAAAVSIASKSQEPTASHRSKSFHETQKDEDMSPGNRGSSEELSKSAAQSFQEEKQKKPVAASPGTFQAWEQKQKLTQQLERANKRLAKKEQELADLQQELMACKVTLKTQQSKLEEQSSTIKQLQKQPRLNADGQTLRRYAQQVVDMEEQVSNLQTELTLIKQHQNLQPPSSALMPSSSFHMQLFEAQLLRDQMQMQVQRLKQHLLHLFGVADSESLSGGKVIGISSGRKPQSMSLNANREAELLSTIASLKLALEQAALSTVTTSKFMQEVGKKKELQRQLTDTNKKLADAKRQASVMDRKRNELQVLITELRQQLASAQLQAPPQEASNRMTALEQIISNQNTELQALRSALNQRDQQGNAADARLMEERIAVLEKENADLRNELDAFDPDFFEEIEDLKHDHAQLAARCADYERQLQALHP